MSFEWDPAKAEGNYRKHGVRLAEASVVVYDDYGITIPDSESDPNEQRFVTLGMGAKGRLLVVVYTYRGENIRIISARSASPSECEQYEASR